MLNSLTDTDTDTHIYRTKKLDSITSFNISRYLEFRAKDVVNDVFAHLRGKSLSIMLSFASLYLTENFIDLGVFKLLAIPI